MSEAIKIPYAWSWKPFAEVATIASDLVDPRDFQDSFHVAPNHIESWTGKLLTYGRVRDDEVTSPKHRFRAGQILYSKIRPYLAKVALATFPGVCSADMYPIDASIDPRFLLHWMLTPWFTQETAKNQGRTILPKINQVALNRMPVPVAPLNEQRRIVAKIDELFSDLDAGVAALERVQANLKRYRAAVLKSAIEGKLTAQWRKKNKPAETGEQLLTNRYGFETKSIQELTTKVGSGATPRGGESVYQKDGVPFIRSLNVHFDGFRKEGLAFIGEVHARELRSVEVRANDVLLNITGASIGRVAQAPFEMDGARVSQHVCILRPNELLDPTFLKWYLASPSQQSLINRQQTGATRQGLTKEKILKFQIPFLPLAVQRKIVSEISSRFLYAGEIEKAVQRGLLRSSRLRQAILKHAFEGKLVPQDPADEPVDIQGNSPSQGGVTTESNSTSSTTRGRSRRA